MRQVHDKAKGIIYDFVECKVQQWENQYFNACTDQQKIYPRKYRYFQGVGFEIFLSFTNQLILFIYQPKSLINPMFNNYSNQNAFNTLQQYQLQQQSQSEYIIQQSFNNLTSSLQKVNYLQGDVCLQNLIIILRCLQTESTESMTRISSPSSSTGQKQSPLNFSLAGKFKAIKQRNHELLIRLLNLRQKLIHSTYMYKIRSQQTQGELDKLSEKIRHLKLIVNNKYSQLKFMRMSKDSMAYKKQSYNYSPLTVPLKDLQKGAEVVEKQSIRMRQELSLLIKYMHGEQV